MYSSALLLGIKQILSFNRQQPLKNIRFDGCPEQITLAKRAIHSPERFPLRFCLDSFCYDIEAQFPANLDYGGDDDALGGALRHLADQALVDLDFGQWIEVEIPKG